MMNVNIDEAITKEETIDILHALLNKVVEDYRGRAEENESCRVYIDGMYFIPQNCACRPFIQVGDKGFGLYRCKMGVHFPYGFDYKKERAEGCRLREAL